MPHVILAETDAFGLTLHKARTVNIRGTQLVSQVSWIRDLAPDPLAGYPAADVEDYAGGPFFRARSDSEHEATALAGLNEQLERKHTRQHLGLLPQFHPHPHNTSTLAPSTHRAQQSAR